MAKLDPEITITVKFELACSMWDALKFRMLGKEAKKELFKKLGQVVATLESNSE